MVAFTDVSRHTTAQLPGSLAGHAPRQHAAHVIIWLCFSLAVLCANTRACLAQGSSDTFDNQTLHISFISLKPGHAIGSSQLNLHPDNSLAFSIEGETLINTGGTWSRQANRFSASVHFTIDKQTPFHYLLKFDGYRMMELYAGRACLYEYDRKKRPTQKIWFLFYALPPGTRTHIPYGKP